MIEARGLVKRYGATAAVNDLSFRIRPGLVTGFLGQNGAGKTTTMRLILGLDRPSAGTVTVNGQPYAASPAPMHEVGALLDAGAVHGGRSARNHLLGLAQTNGISRRRVDEVLGVVGLTDVAAKRTKGFSLGMRQRLGVAHGGTVLDPEVVRQLLTASRRRDTLAALTPREREVLSLIAQGRSNAAIAGTLFISPKVVEKHVANIFDKLGLAPDDNDNRRVIAALRYLES
jgi:DNA-binding CsgD family transcriptional regulator